MNLAEKIVFAMTESGLKAADIIRAFRERGVDITHQHINGWKKTGSIERANLALFAEVTGYELSSFMNPNDDGPPRRTSAPRGVPLVGLAVATPIGDGFYDDQGFAPGAGAEFVPWHTRDPNAYALRIRGDSMQDRIRHGEIVIVEPNAAVHGGDDVLVRLKDGRRMVNRFEHKRGGEYTFRSVNQAHRDLTISIEEVEVMHRIAAILPRGSFTEEGQG